MGADFHLQRGSFDAPLALACAAKALAHKAEGALAQLALGFVDGLPLELESAALGEGLGGSAASGSSGSSQGASRSSLQEETKEGKKAGGAEGEAGQDGYRDAPSPVLDKFEAMECWLRGGSSSSTGYASAASAAPGSISTFPLLVTRDYGEDVRGVHMRCDCEAECELMSVGEAYVLTVEKAKAHPLCQALARGGVDRELSAAKHCYLALYLLCTRYDAACPFAAYYAILPRAFPSIPLFWTPREAAWLAGSHVAEQVEDRRRNILADFRLILECVPELAGAFSAEEFLWARMVVASRNFGITVDGVRTDALVPYADMLNHLRPRQTRWLYDSARRAFLIVSLQPLVAGQQVFDSYGKKCNSRFLLNYGFTVEHNADDDTGQFHNELRLVLGLPPPSADPWHWHKADRLGGGSTCVRRGRGGGCARPALFCFPPRSYSLATPHPPNIFFFLAPGRALCAFPRTMTARGRWRPFPSCALRTPAGRGMASRPPPPSASSMPSWALPLSPARAQRQWAALPPPPTCRRAVTWRTAPQR